jgi:mannitol-1-phosphate 5-dehydrogenase
MKALVFGAGNIGRGFLGLQLAKSGFEVTFIDVDAVKVTALNDEREYPVYIVSAKGTEIEVVNGLSAILLSDAESIEQAVIDADVVLTAVGKSALQFVAESLARGLIKRITKRPISEMHIAVIACENVQDNTAFLCNLMSKYVSPDDMERILNTVSFPNCVVDRIVPNTVPSRKESVLAVTVEDYFQLVVDGQGLKSPLPDIVGMDVSMNLSATLEQKLCTLNMAHAVVGYFGHLRGYQFVHEAAADSEIEMLLQGALEEVSITITKRHRHISRVQQQGYAKRVVARFKNQHLRDEIVRVARQPLRKLGPDDRLIKPALLCVAQGVTPVFLACGVTAALHYDCVVDPEAQNLALNIKEYGIERVLQQVCGLTGDSDVGRLIKADFLLRAL